MFRTKMYLVCAATALALAWAGPAAADNIISFDPTGTGAGSNIDSFDQSAGNSMAIGITTSNVPGVFTAVYQANLANAMLGSSVIVAGDGTGLADGNFFTFTGMFNQSVTSVSPAGNIFTFGLAPGPNVFTMYQNSTGRADDATGMGFITDNPILTASVISAKEVFTFDNLTGPSCGDVTNPGCLLDPGGNNPNSAGIQTLYGRGSISLTLAITFADPLYFPGLNPGTTFAFSSTDQTLPFRNGTPTDCFFNTGAVACSGAGELAGLSSVDPVNGVSGPNTMFESDARTSFQDQEIPIPEPATLTLLGFGLLGSAAARRRQKKAKK